MKRLSFLMVALVFGHIVTVPGTANADELARIAPKLSLLDLKNVRLPDVTFDSVRHFDAGDNGAKVSHFQVLGMIGGSIGFELLLPDEWNQRFVMGGGGLFVGTIQNQARFSINDGYATVGTDTGHRSASVYLADWAYLDIEAQLNFGFLAVHRTAEVSKALIRLCYGSDAVYSYFYGCSTGGRQGLMEAARYPNDFDGIVSACPVASKTGLYASFIQHVQIFLPPGMVGPLLTVSQLEAFHQQVLDQCDEADGLKDGIINNPLECQLNWGRITGLNQAQTKALRLVYRGPKVGKESLYPGLPLGSELRWYRWFAGPDPDQTAVGSRLSSLGRACTQFGRYLVFDDPAWTPVDYNLADWRRDTRRASAILDCSNPDLQSFHEAGGKLIIWHSWSDGALSAKGSIEYFESIDHANKNDFIRLYLLPGVFHCQGGPGPSETNWLNVISGWVERNDVPYRLLVQKRNNGEVEMTRPIWPYPIHAKYKGAGDPNDAGSFEPVEPRTTRVPSEAE